MIVGETGAGAGPGAGGAGGGGSGGAGGNSGGIIGPGGMIGPGIGIGGTKPNPRCFGFMEEAPLRCPGLILL